MITTANQARLTAGPVLLWWLAISGQAARADVALPPEHVKPTRPACTVAEQAKPGEECLACRSRVGKAGRCAELLEGHAFSRRCWLARGVVRNEVWCREEQADARPVPAEVQAILADAGASLEAAGETVGTAVGTAATSSAGPEAAAAAAVAEAARIAAEEQAAATGSGRPAQGPFARPPPPAPAAAEPPPAEAAAAAGLPTAAAGQPTPATRTAGGRGCAVASAASAPSPEDAAALLAVALGMLLCRPRQ
ncbi:MAG: hypothetical protein FJ125_13985 [Deltaproteobacteria bacterium]|nr:hypothetical protein [Deltaproteobacteria bacterium]